MKEIVTQDVCPHCGHIYKCTEVVECAKKDNGWLVKCPQCAEITAKVVGSASIYGKAADICDGLSIAIKLKRYAKLIDAAKEAIEHLNRARIDVGTYTCGECGATPGRFHLEGCKSLAIIRATMRLEDALKDALKEAM